ncbi:dihydroorotate dehydrogenase (quinone) [Paenibacillus sp. BIHB 4019]|uniref:Dihydroorotate dehydrogenase (quinone) n=1 Tax=Paenibacillus sp. BIHB 4019 TaxID=1870819 RepID=A0A1B2DLI1_9BACL|nr:MULTISPECIES: quinone-dependent dihydroorotate dehydrogenase [unclassified Paenibacillus]ANY68557.1 dihydroorotate dehydrogenase (quinone) [Paenibacillus sp. BIHB 4019]KQO17695.1 dihydroorotate dehydrogenase (quinone) [Paenibacillus sp. Leaf72]
MLYSSLGKPIFFRMDPEKAHHLVIDGLHAAGRVPGMTSIMHAMYGVNETPELAVDLFGIHFPHPIGLAAGLDKNAKAADGFSSIGFGFMEVGTVTPKSQPGNEQPRLFRLPPDEALINRMGFNNDGVDAMAERLNKRKIHRIPLAVNIGKNKVTPNELAHEDYRLCIQALYGQGDFFVVNISSPNTPDLRALQHGDELRLLLDTVLEEIRQQASKSGKSAKPVLVKIAPDMTDEQLKLTVATIKDSGVSGIIATNTTVSRTGLTHSNAGEMGGLSGVPVRERSTEVIRAVYRQTEGKLPIIGSGGIFTAADAYDKIRAGASLVEVYTALIYKGPGLLRELTSGLKERLRKDGYRSITEAIGADHR